MDRGRIEAELAGVGLIWRGAFRPGPGDGLPEELAGAGTVVLVGNAGPGMWRVFSRSPEHRDDTGAGHPLDDWSRRVVGEVAARLGARVLLPFDGPPYLPFQTWAMKADRVWPSPIGALVHPRFGLWHAYRGALVFAERLALADAARGASPCETCRERPCLHACPVGAFDGGGYDVPACTGHLGSAAGGDCLGGGCLARRACPIGREFRHGAEQARFHMERFLRDRR